MSLNSKKSWHPGTALNRAKVQQKEEDELNKKLEHEKRLETLKEEHALEELRNANRDTNNTNDTNNASNTTTNDTKINDTSNQHQASRKTSWMYNSEQKAEVTTHNPEISEVLYGSGPIEQAPAPKVYDLGNNNTSTPSDEARKRAADPLYKVLEMRESHRKNSAHDSIRRKDSRYDSRHESRRR